jgi:hypothetical protein
MDHLTPVVQQLIHSGQDTLALQLLQHYAGQATTLEQVDTVGQLALRHHWPQLAVDMAQRALALAQSNEQLYAARDNLARALCANNQPELALDYNYVNLTITPNDYQAITQHATYLKFAGRRAESEDIIQRLRTTDLTPEQRHDLTITDTHRLLRTGQTAAGIANFLRTQQPKITQFDIFGMTLWDGIPRPGQLLYVNDEGGYGDQLINIRFFQHVADLGMRPVLYSGLDRPEINSVFRRHGHTVLTRPEDILGRPAPWVNLMHLPVLLNVTEQDLWRGPYLQARHPQPRQRQIAIKCQGNPRFAQDVYRRVPLSMMMTATRPTDTVWVLDSDMDLTGTTARRAPPMSSWEDTLDFLSGQDLVISSCTSVAHAAGALGVTTAVLVPVSEYYVWTSTQTQGTAWYGPNMHVFRQTQPRDWTQPLAQVVQLRDQQ